jgi:hypothetical protein
MEDLLGILFGVLIGVLIGASIPSSCACDRYYGYIDALRDDKTITLAKVDSMANAYLVKHDLTHCKK